MIALLLSSLASAQDYPGPSVLEPPSEQVISQLLAREEEILATVKEADPEAWERLVRLRSVDRAAYVVQLFKAGRTIERARTDPAFLERLRAIQDKERELRELADGFSALSASEQKARRKELERVAGELMDLKQAERRAKLEEVRAKLAELEAEIDERERDRERIVGEFVDQLLAEPVDL